MFVVNVCVRVRQSPPLRPLKLPQAPAEGADPACVVDKSAARSECVCSVLLVNHFKAPINRYC